ncbi:MAG: Spy/CpxP family protein refolding chaperone [Neptuniibacter sp.]
MRKKLIAGITAAAITFAGLGFTVAHAKGGHDFMEKRLQHLTQELDLTKEQQSQLSDSMESSKKAMQETRQTRNEIRKELMKLDPNSPDYQTKLDSLVLKAQEQAKQMVVQKAEQKQAIFSVLNEEQKQEFTELQEKWQSKMEKRFADGDHPKRGKGCH